MKKYIYLLLLSFVVFLISSTAQIYGLVHTPKDMVFLGGHYPNSGEILKIVLPQLKEGHILIKNLFTSEPQPYIFFAGSYLPIYLLSRIFPLSDYFIMEISRFIFTYLFFIVVYFFLKLFFERKKIILSLLLISVASGFGFIVKPFVPTSIDLWIPEAITFHSIMYSPNFILLQTLMLLSIYFLIKNIILIKNTNKVDYKLIFGSSLLMGIIALEHQFNTITILLSLFLFIFFETKNLKDAFKYFKKLHLIFIVPTLVLLILTYQVYSNPNVLSWTKNTHLDSPYFLSYITGYGFVGLFAFYFLIKNDFNKITTSYRLIFYWIVSVIFLIYSPIPFQRRFTEGLFVPLVILATTPFWNLIYRIKYKLIIILLFTLLASSNIYLIFQDIRAFQIDPIQSPFYVYKEDIKTLEWLKLHTDENDIILSDTNYSTLIPGLIGRTVYFGHNVGTVMTIDNMRKTEEAKNFFFRNSDEDRYRFLNKNRITYFYLGKKASSAEDYKVWDKKKYMKKVYEGDGTKIFKITD